MQLNNTTLAQKNQPSNFNQFSDTSGVVNDTFWIHATKSNHCPICDHDDWCQHVEDESVFHCHRPPTTYQFFKLYEIPGLGEMLSVPVRGEPTGMAFVIVTPNRRNRVAQITSITTLNTMKRSIAEIVRVDEWLHKIAGFGTPLTDKELEYLEKKHGMTVEDTEMVQAFVQDGYTLSRINHWIKDYQVVAQGMPGTRITKSGRVVWNNQQYGIMFPLMNVDNRYQSMILRVLGQTKGDKYKLLIDEAKIGQSGYSILYNPSGTIDVCLVSEGVQKVQQGMKRIGYKYGIAVTGITKRVQAVEAAIALIQKHHVGEFHLSFDHEVDEKKEANVRRLEVDLADQLALIASTVVRLDWNARIGKGLDDLLLANGGLVHIEHVRSEKVQAVQPIIDYLADTKQKNTIARFTLSAGRTALTEWIVKRGPGHVYSGVALNRSDAGLGKTRAIIFMLLQANEARNTERTLILFDDLARMEEFRVMIALVLNDHDVKKVLDELAMVKGRNEKNCDSKTYYEKVQPLQEKGRNVSRYACSSCPLKKSGCEYYKQFPLAQAATYVQATHANMSYLVNGYANNEKLPIGDFEHVIIDENPITALYSTNDWTVARLQSKSNFLQVLLEEGALEAAKQARLAEISENDETERVMLTEFTREKIQEVKYAIDTLIALLIKYSAKKEYSLLIPERDFIQKLIRTIGLKPLENAIQFVREQTNILGEVEILETKPNSMTGRVEAIGLSELFRALDSAQKGTINARHRAVIAKQGIVKDEDDVNSAIKIVVAVRNDQLITRLEQRAVVLDATANVELYKRIFNNFTYNDIRVHPIRNDYRMIAALGFSRSMLSLRKRVTAQNMREFIEQQRLNATDTALITTKAMRDNMKEIQFFAGYVIEHYGAGARGTNRLENHRNYVVTAYAHNLLAKAIEYQVLTGEAFSICEKEEDILDIVSGYTRSRRLTGHKGFDAYYMEEIKAELYQAVMRSRLINRDVLITVYYLGDPTLWPDELPPLQEKTKFVSTEKSRQTSKINKAASIEKVEKMGEVAIALLEKYGSEKVNVMDYIRENEIIMRVAEELSELIGRDIKTIAAWFKDDTFLRILSAMGITVNTKARSHVVKRAVRVAMTRMMKLAGMIDDEKAILNQLAHRYERGTVKHRRT